ncbi:MAG: hypothetical protein AB7S48_00875 [Bacteroidales bacterium]
MQLNHSQAIIDKIFSLDIFKELKKNSLLLKYDITNAVYEIITGIKSFRDPKLQTDNVITAIPPEGIIINSPGIYQFANDITWNSVNTDCTAITIVASNVVLDLCGYSLTANIQQNDKFIVGIKVEDASNITIQNGNLLHMGFYGICADTVNSLTIDSIVVDGISFNNTAVRCLTPCGIHINKSSNVVITGCSILNVNVTSDAFAGIQILETNIGFVSQCVMNNFVNNDGSVQGFSYLFCSKILTSNCDAGSFQSHFNGNILTPGHTVIGFIPIFCIGLTYNNYTATNIIGCCDDCHGMSVFLDAYITVNNFTADTVIDGITPTNTGAKATGLEVYGVAVSISNCQVENIRAINPQDKQSTGFSAAGSEIAFINCSANNITVTDANGNVNPLLGNGTGFGWAPDPRYPFRNFAAQNIIYNDCSAANCQVGFDTWYHISSIWNGINSENCTTKILNEPQGLRTLSGDPGSECNPPIVITIMNIAFNNKYPNIY